MKLDANKSCCVRSSDCEKQSEPVDTFSNLMYQVYTLSWTTKDATTNCSLSGCSYHRSFKPTRRSSQTAGQRDSQPDSQTASQKNKQTNSQGGKQADRLTRRQRENPDTRGHTVGHQAEHNTRVLLIISRTACVWWAQLNFNERTREYSNDCSLLYISLVCINNIYAG